MVIHEMDLEMTTSESCFQADNASDCYRHWCTHLSQPFTLPGSRPLFLAELISILMRDNYDAHAVKFANMSTLNLFVIISGRQFFTSAFFEVITLEAHSDDNMLSDDCLIGQVSTQSSFNNSVSLPAFPLACSPFVPHFQDGNPCGDCGATTNTSTYRIPELRLRGNRGRIQGS